MPLSYKKSTGIYSTGNPFSLFYVTNKTGFKFDDTLSILTAAAAKRDTRAEVALIATMVILILARIQNGLKKKL